MQLNWNGCWYFDNPWESKRLSLFTLQSKWYTYHQIFKKNRCWNGSVKKCKGKGFNHRSIGIEKAKMFINESLCRTLTSYGVNAKHYGQRNGLKPSGLTMTKMKIRIKPEGAVSRITHITDLQKLFPSYDFQLNKFPITSHHWYRSFYVYICRIHAMTRLEPCHFWDGPHCDFSWLFWFAKCCHRELRSSCDRILGSILGHVYIVFLFQLLVLGDFRFISAKFSIYLPSWRKCCTLWNCILSGILMTWFMLPVAIHPL